MTLVEKAVVALHQSSDVSIVSTEFSGVIVISSVASNFRHSSVNRGHLENTCFASSFIPLQDGQSEKFSYLYLYWYAVKYRVLIATALNIKSNYRGYIVPTYSLSRCVHLPLVELSHRCYQCCKLFRLSFTLISSLSRSVLSCC